MTEYTTGVLERTCPEHGLRKPGGQPGNRNAFKHGIRSRKLTPFGREQLKVRMLLSAMEQAMSLLAARMAALDAAREDNPAFDGNGTNISSLTSAGTKGVFKVFVSIEPSRLKGFINLKTNVTMPMPEVLSSQAKFPDSFR